MFTQFFGNYLLNKGLVKPSELRDALDYQHDVHLKLGVLAVNAGFMTAEQIKNVHSMQSKMDKKFGELAVEMGYLSKPQLEALLGNQKQGHLILGQALVDKHYMSLEQFEKALNQYKAEHGLSDTQFKALQNDSIVEIVTLFYAFNEKKNSSMYRDYFTLLFKNLIRFIDKDVRPEKPQAVEEYKYDWIAFQEIKGEINLFTCIAADENVFINFGGKYANEPFDAVDDMTKASVGEFLNMQNGIFLVNMSNGDIELEMTPQETSTRKRLVNLKPAYCIPLYFPFGKLDFIISESSPEIV